MDTVSIEGLRLATVIGVFEWEREVQQTLGLDLVLQVDIAAAASSDRLEDTVDYGALAADLAGFYQESRYQLVEALAEATAKRVLSRYPVVSTVTVRLAKPVKVPPAGNFDAVVTIARGRAAS
ncbi:dihydroneopterin aldolase [Alkalilimnicola ehrlichii]|nr:dihydroneopterin aldolase [Alkalilimnicola ehrlichii]